MTQYAEQLIELALRIRSLSGFAQWCTERDVEGKLVSDWSPEPHLLFLARRIQNRIEAARQGDPKNILILEAPPRHGKSELVSKRLPAWFLSRWPSDRVLLTSYAAEFSRVWGRRTRAIIEDRSKELGLRISDSQSAANDWEIDGYGGGMATTGVGGPLTGRGGRLLIIDDPIKNSEEAESPTVRESHWDWWQTTASTRIEPGGCAIVMMTRWHRDDLIGRILAKDAGRVERITLPAIAKENDPLDRRVGEPLWPSRWSIENLNRQRLSISRPWWEAMYQQNPIASGETEFSENWFANSWFERWPETLILKVLIIDPSKGKDSKRADYQALVKLGIGSDDCLYVQADMQRRSIPQMVADTVAIYKDFQPQIFGLEANSWQDLLAPDFAEEFRSQGIIAPEVWQINNAVNKLVRIRRLAGYLSQGRIRFKQDCPGTKILIDQLIDFPNGVHDDGPDALEMAIRLAEQISMGG